MSKGYGWQCESAILPSKSVPINNVDSSSLLALKAIISKPSSLHRVRKNEDDINPSTKRPKVDFFANKKKVESIKPVTKFTDEQSEKEAHVLQSLTAKAKLYEEMAGGDSMGSSGGLVDFKRKNEEEELGFFIDKGGDNNIINNNNNNDEEHIDFEAEYRNEKGFSKLIEDRIVTEQQQQQPQPADIASLSRGAKVKSRWDITLQSSSKAFLDEIHNQTEKQRNQSSVKGGASSIREERLEKLRQKQQQMGMD